MYEQVLLGNTDTDRTYPWGTFESVNPDPEVIRAAAVNLRGINAEGEGVLKPVQNKRGREEFSPREEVDVSECQTGGPEQTPGGRRRCKERLSNPGEKLEEGDQTSVCRVGYQKTGPTVPRAVFAAGESNPDGQILRSNQELDVEEGGVFKEEGEEGSGLASHEGQIRRGRRKGEDAGPQGVKEPAADSGPEKRWNDQKATRHFNRPHSGERVASSGTVL
ncbi:hypothetical protein NDU88_004478 [Pleurodeles waltl]|uniref:Uncharacterized protein n=1 Tax=Pleurodeles waltl TaxID=8319 RepID=A0AAV7KYI1_PLEWA|nr:hypothetical protein NDU88_004478 [Pleurodeles waltl]